MAKIIHFVISSWFLEDHLMTDFPAKTRVSNVNWMNLYAKETNLITKTL